MKNVKIVSLVLVAGLIISGATPAAQSQTPGTRLTIYNQNFGLIKDQRDINLQDGFNTIIIDDVAAMIQPETVHFTSLTAPASVTILEQNYQYDLLDPQSVINKSVGKRVKVYNPESNTTIEGTLLNPMTWEMQGGWRQQGGDKQARYPNPGALVIKTGTGIVMGAEGRIEIQDLPEGLVSKPRLVWRLNASKPGQHKAEISYLSQGLNWKADYVAAVSADDSSIGLQGWVTLTNTCGTSFRNAKLQLVAGDVRRVVGDEVYDKRFSLRKAAKALEKAPQFQEQQFFDYHLYTLQRPTDVLDRETKQISLLEAVGVKAVKRYYYDGVKQSSWWHQPDWRPGEQYDTSNYRKVNVTIEFKNSKGSHLGIPLPKGTVRVYKKDKQGNLQFVGEDEIDHTPKDEKVKLYVGDAFDMVGEHKRLNFRRISQHVTEEKFQITLRNHQDKAVQVTVVEHATADWQILNSSHKWVKIDARTLNFPVTVPANGSVVVKYHIQTRF